MSKVPLASEHFTPLFVTSETGVSQTKQFKLLALVNNVVKVKEEVLTVTEETFPPVEEIMRLV